MYIRNEGNMWYESKKTHPIMTHSARHDLANEMYANQFHPSLRHIFLKK
jgi:hypothetical protein